MGASGLTEEQAKSHAEGWDHYFERLERVATTGDAGPDEWVYAPENLTPIVAAEAALAALQPILRNLTPEDQPKPTPCADFTCHELAEHLLMSLGQLGAPCPALADRRSPALFAASILPVELALHGWDLAQSSGQTVHISDELVDYLRGLAEGVVPGGRGRSFGDEAVPPEGACALDRLAAYAGRAALA